VYAALCFAVAGADLAVVYGVPGDPEPSRVAGFAALGALVGGFMGFVVGRLFTVLVQRFFPDHSRWSDGCLMGGIFGACVGVFAVVMLRPVGMVVLVTLVAGVGGFICGWLARDSPPI